MNVLLTGAQGFIGRNIAPFLRKKYKLFSPNRFELNLLDEAEVKKYVKDNKIDIIIHSANPNPYKEANLDKNETFLRDSLRMFLIVLACKRFVKKIIFIGSGAMYDKTRDIVDIKECDFGNHIPIDEYAVAKYVMNMLAGDNVYNFVVFGCYGPTDDKSKFITHCIRCVLRNEKITIRQDCLFDYMHVNDLADILSWGIDNQLKYNTYNVVSGKKVSLFQIASIVRQKMNSDLPIVILNDGVNKEYTASNMRLLEEYDKTFISIEQGIEMQIEWEKDNFKV